ncbi:MAG: cysteine hydrolase family protein [Candidatus Bipolaricaulis sp.]|nr:cysteine hydrolase family protein [Candidatus Bipolaricaulis sp.]
MKALLVIDMQTGLFAGAVRYDADGVVRRINDLARAVRGKGGAVVFVQHNGDKDSDLAPQSPGWQILPALDRRPTDPVVQKTACDSFYRSELERILRERKIAKLLVTGCATEFCVDTTIRSAASKDYDVIVVADGHTTADRPHLSAEKIIEHHNRVWANLILPEHPVGVVAAETLLTTL